MGIDIGKNSFHLIQVTTDFATEPWDDVARIAIALKTPIEFPLGDGIPKPRACLRGQLGWPTGRQIPTPDAIW